MYTSIKIKDLLRGVNVIDMGNADENLTVSGVTSNNGKVDKNFAFVAIAGTRFDGHTFINDAAEKGAVCAVVEYVPENCTMVEAAAIPEAFATAYLNLFHEGKAKAGYTLLMQAGASGLASVVIPMAKAFGLRVITTVLGAQKVKEIAHLGADVIVDTTTESLEEVLKRELEAGHPVDVAID